MRAEAARELLAARADVWAFLAEPHHLPDWWPDMHGVEPDRRGFAPGARWVVRGLDRRPLLGGREPKQPMDARYRCDRVRPSAGPGTSPATCRSTSRSGLRRRATTARKVEDRGRGGRLANPKKLARTALDRLYDLVQTADSGLRAAPSWPLPRISR